MNGFKCKGDNLRLDTRKEFFTVGMLRHWHRLPKEVLGAVSLEVFEARLHGVPSNLVLWKLSLSVAGMESDGLYCPFQPKCFYDWKQEVRNQEWPVLVCAWKSLN